MSAFMLTTVDNPYDPSTEFDNWYDFDASAGYHSPEFLARVAVLSPELTDQEMSDAIEQAIDEIIDINPLGIYRKVPVKKVNENS